MIIGSIIAGFIQFIVNNVKAIFEPFNKDDKDLSEYEKMRKQEGR